MLARGELQTIGATTLDEYRKYVEKDPALERRFQPIQVSEPSVEHTIEILRGLRDRYEAHHRVTITDDALDLGGDAGRPLHQRPLPADKAIDLIDEAARPDAHPPDDRSAGPAGSSTRDRERPPGQGRRSTRRTSSGPRTCATGETPARREGRAREAVEVGATSTSSRRSTASRSPRCWGTGPASRCFKLTEEGDDPSCSRWRTRSTSGSSAMRTRSAPSRRRSVVPAPV
ncbi:hypothetical protein [Pseudonocardia sp. ICBG601]|uniref:hypothetical protein n=1 Tax=Pseudonocardia sp. ICBG601 TaxID=2846759 RepID=UPI001CF6C87C